MLAQVISGMEAELVVAVARANKTLAAAVAEALMGAYEDLDELLGCDYGFLLGPWVAQAVAWANTSDGATAEYYEWQARSQVSTWWPVAPSARSVPETFTKLPVLDNYANKHWNGLIRDFYAKRVQCYVDQFMVDLPASKMNESNLTKCVTTAELDFTQDTVTKYDSVPTREKTLVLSAALIAKYAKYL